jgi:long-subunit acyl-CoA synthetase (AMP-forming)
VLKTQFDLPVRSPIGILGYNCVEWVIADLAGVFGGYITVPLYCGAEDAKYQFIVEQSEIKVIFCDHLHYPIISRLFEPSQVRVVLFGHHPELPAPSVHSLLAQLPPDFAASEWVPSEKTDILTVMYTSGSTGRPKGAIMTEDRWHRFLCENYRVTYPYRIISASQLPHIMERQNVRPLLYFFPSIRLFHDQQQLFITRFLSPAALLGPPCLCYCLFVVVSCVFCLLTKQYFTGVVLRCD